MATVITNTALAAITATLAASTNRHVSWGTGAGTAAATDTDLFTESSEARVLGTQSQETDTVTNDTYQVVATLTAEGARSITNAGVFDAATAGNLFIKGDFASPIDLAQGEALTLTVRAVFS